MNPESPTAPLVLREIETTLRGTSIHITHSAVRKSADLRVAFATLESERVDGIVVVGDTVIFTEAAQVISLAAAARLPAIHGYRQHVEQGGLMSYGLDIPQNFRRAAYFVDRILKGTKPADLPIELPPKLELVINLSVAKALGLEVPPTLLAIADAVIE